MQQERGQAQKNADADSCRIAGTGSIGTSACASLVTVYGQRFSVDFHPATMLQYGTGHVPAVDSRSDAASSSYTVTTQAKSASDMQLEGVPARVSAEILSYQRLRDYYGESLKATSVNDCNAAVDFLTFAITQNPAIAMPSSISPSVEGGISLYWERGACQLFAEILAGNTTEISYQFLSPDGQFSVGTEIRENILEKLSSIYSR